MKRLEGQKRILAETKSALDDALARKMIAVATACDSKLKRQSEACAKTQAQIVELEAAIREDDTQTDAFKPETNVTPHKRKS